MSDDNFDLAQFLPYLLNQAAEASSLAFQQFYKDRHGTLRAEWRVPVPLGLYVPVTASLSGAPAHLPKAHNRPGLPQRAEALCETLARRQPCPRPRHPSPPPPV